MLSDDIIRYDFPWPNPDKGYSLFPAELENDELVFFHGTALKNLEAISKEGFKTFPPLTSVSYAKRSSMSLDHVIRQRYQWGEAEGVVFAVRFDSLADPAIVVNTSDIHVYKVELQPKLIGYCVVPASYQHR